MAIGEMVSKDAWPSGVPGMVAGTEDDCCCSATSCSSSTGVSDLERSGRADDAPTDSDVLSVMEGRSESTSSFGGSARLTGRDDVALVFDWDDTLCPTTFGSSADQASLRRLAREVERILRAACALGRVEVVSARGSEWVAETTERFMPSICGLLEELRIPISSSVGEGAFARCRRLVANSATEEGKRSLGRSTAKIIRKMCRYKAAGHTSTSVVPMELAWRHVIGIGDSLLQRVASQDDALDSQLQIQGRRRLCHCKFVKLKAEPTVAELSAQLRRVSESLLEMVHHDGDLSLEFEDEEVREALVYLHRRA
mmetsp:Transcript_95441/g.275559  ORF Transcript_95441/g.275559 Transcript_95441/m.275559 type:complete len:312 (+) Transcript_95441:52-987(+)